MEKLIAIVMSYWSTILEYALMIVAYVLVFLYRSKVNTSQNNVTTLFKEQTQDAVKSNNELRAQLENDRAYMGKELAEAKSRYDTAVKSINSLRVKSDKLERALLAIIDSEEVVCNDTETVDSVTESE